MVVYRSEPAPILPLLLPHQAELVERVSTMPGSGVILGHAVGTGKTFMLGGIVDRFRLDRNYRRVLIITSASLCSPLREQLQGSFGQDFDHYNVDFRIHRPSQWLRYDRVIASLELVRPRSNDDHGTSFDTHFGKIILSGDWDAVVFDEAHHVTEPDESEATYARKLALALREKTNFMLMMSATIHQGRPRQFRESMKLARPELAPLIDNPDTFDEAVAATVLRCRKSDLTDRAGNFVMKGQECRLLKV